ncbi:hypothetical protein CR159_20720 [Pollutimonas subterranea]|uniref:Uncharacterized protein n=1 Tax=Pollutimonas subterranea TaxID=2045210 RepID=A0A2N4TYW8_9BURK|nr:DUF6884 domain-containing protein [Pollutimonas subterranea]PLC47963.1 hypothetical protein CR159_20720 [Pollutimonas subterranea]
MEPIRPVVLVSCGKRKLDVPAAARDLYVSERFRQARKFAELYGAEWFIISAKYGLVFPDQVLNPYDLDLNALPIRDKLTWGDRILSELSKNELLNQHLVVLASEVYSEILQGVLAKAGAVVTSPFRDLPEDAGVNILTRVNGNPAQMSHYKKFYDLMLRLQQMPGQMTAFSELVGKPLSKAGVYFFFGPHELTRFYDRETLRVVRVGTHGVSKGSKSLLWQRLRTHRGNDDGTGSHRSSVFRLHVGDAILAAQGREILSWGVGGNATRETRESERQLETEVSQYLRKLHVAYLPVVDAASADSDRSYIEKNAISLLTGGGAIDVQGTQWLGNFSPTQQIKSSGLWNVNYVGDSYDPNFLSIFEELITRYEEGRLSEKSLAPQNWRLHMQRGAIGQQQLF